MKTSEQRWKRRADALLGVVASCILLAMMFLTVVDVVARYAFSRPLRGAFEVTELMLLVLIFAGLPLVSFSDEHATMDFIDRLLGVRAQRWLERACAAFIDLRRAIGAQTAAHDGDGAIFPDRIFRLRVTGAAALQEPRDCRYLVPGSQIAIEIESCDRRQRHRGRDPEKREHQGQAPVHWLIRDLRNAHFNNRRR